MEMRIDLGSKFQFPEIMLFTTESLNVLIYAKKVKKIIIVELTVPQEKGEEAVERKTCK